ncbi:MAG: hypothetical protein WCD76_08550, partial [Pyrinomonadaceae bacterium]
MTDPKEKTKKPQIREREPKKATPPGIFDNLRRLPHPVEEIMGLTMARTVESETTQPIPTHPNPSQPIPTHPNP